MAEALAMQHLRSRRGCGYSRLRAAARLHSQEASRDPNYHFLFSFLCIKFERRCDRCIFSKILCMI